MLSKPSPGLCFSVWFLLFFHCLFKNSIQCVFILVTPPPALLPTLLCVLLFFFFIQVQFVLQHTSLGVWPSSQQLSIANSSSSRNSDWFPPPLSTLGVGPAWASSELVHVVMVTVSSHGQLPCPENTISLQSSATSGSYCLLFCPDLRVWGGRAMIEKARLGMSTPQLFSALQPVVGLRVYHHLLQIEASVRRAERMNTGITISH